MSDPTTQTFNDHRELLFSIVYNMLGTVADTEDVLQETWLAWSGRGGAPVEHPRAYLVRIAVNRALAERAAVSRRRETYVGPWLPEPLVGPLGDEAADATVRAESVSMALLVVLETLTPLERAVFVLHEVFGYAHTEIAGILGRSDAAVRQIAHRAREHVHARRPRYEPEPSVRQAVTERFLAAATGGDLEALLQLLAPDVTLWGDGGGVTSAGGVRPLAGRDKVARLIAAIAQRPGPGLDIVYRSVNGEPSAVLLAGGRAYAVVNLDLTPDGRQVRGIYVVANPDKLSRVD
ncbi:RNA polymerase sigma factor SigJ [Dactylosporangium sp. CA-139066]|uniref:RNA polymerase sigma factor SigJ n=1 Tax=Dactylosporangium sp. CA-139066 TaxID=3239930 RepID=UPI003D8A3EA7